MFYHTHLFLWLNFWKKITDTDKHTNTPLSSRWLQPEEKKCRTPTTYATFRSTSLSLVSAVYMHTLTSIHFLYFLYFNWLNDWFICEFGIEWLVDRKRIPSDWRKRVAVIKAKISTAFQALPKDADPFFQTLDLDG